MNLNSNIFNSNQKLFNIDLNVITWSNVKPIPQNLNSIVPTFTSSTLTNLPPITSIITSNKKIENYDNLLNEEWDRNGTNIFNLTSNTLNIGGNIKCTDLLINNINIKNISSNLGITNLNIQTNGLINSMLNDSNSYYIIFTSNGFLNIPQDLNCDIILVGAGGNGGNAQSDNSYYNDGFLYTTAKCGQGFCPACPPRQSKSRHVRRYALSNRRAACVHAFQNTANLKNRNGRIAKQCRICGPLHPSPANLRA